MYTATIDAEFSKLFFRHIKNINELEGYHRFIREQTQQQSDQLDTLHAQLVKIDEAQEAILSERLAIQKQINETQNEQEKEQAKREAAPDLERLRRRALQHDTTTTSMKMSLRPYWSARRPIVTSSTANTRL